MIKLRSGSTSLRFSVREKIAHRTEQDGRILDLHRFLLTLSVVISIAVTPDHVTSLGLAHATQENPQGDEIAIPELSSQESGQNDQHDGQVNPVNTLPLAPVTGSNNDQQSCEIVVISPGTIGSSIENKVLSSKLIGGRAGTANITAKNASFNLSVDNPFGFSTTPPGGNASVAMKASFIGHGTTNFSETPGSHSVEINEGLTVVQAHLTAERTDGNPFPAGYYSAELTLRCE